MKWLEHHRTWNSVLSNLTFHLSRHSTCPCAVNTGSILKQVLKVQMAQSIVRRLNSRFTLTPARSINSASHLHRLDQSSTRSEIQGLGSGTTFCRSHWHVATKNQSQWPGCLLLYNTRPGIKASNSCPLIQVTQLDYIWSPCPTLWLFRGTGLQAARQETLQTSWSLKFVWTLALLTLLMSSRTQ